MRLVACAWVLGVGLGWACGPGSFACFSDADCQGGAADGVCIEGLCAFPSGVCESGLQYGEHAGDQSGMCIPPGDPSGSSGPEPPPVMTGGVATSAATTAEVDATSLESVGTTEADDGPQTSDSGPSDSSGPTGDPCDGTPTLLYAQEELGRFGGAPSALDDSGAYVRSADDFEIGEADECWCVTRVVVFGEFLAQNLEGDVDVRFYADGAGLPDDPALWTETGLPGEVEGDFDYTFASPVVLPAGTYWLSMTARIESLMEGVWFWSPSLTDEGSPWAMEATFEPFMAECPDWTAGADCFGAKSSDLAFELHGVVGAGACP